MRGLPRRGVQSFVLVHLYRRKVFFWREQCDECSVGSCARVLTAFLKGAGIAMAGRPLAGFPTEMGQFALQNSGM